MAAKDYGFSGRSNKVTDKINTHAKNISSATVRKSQDSARVSRRQREQVNAADAMARVSEAPASTLLPADIVALQRAAGNRAVGQILSERVLTQQQNQRTIQAKLAIGAADNPYEREADRVAATVMQTSEPSVPHIQRQAVPEEDEEMVQKKPLASSITPMIQRQEWPEKNEGETPIQRRGDSGTASVGSEVELSIERARSGGQPLPDDLRNRMEQSFGADFSGVRVNTDAQADNLNRALHSRAFTTGQDLFFKRGEYDPASRAGQEVIAHELTHVVQQAGNGLRRQQSPKSQASAARMKRHDFPGPVKLLATAGARLVQLLSMPQENEIKRMINAFEIKGLKFDAKDDEYNESNYMVLYKVLSDKGWNTDKKNIDEATAIIKKETGMGLIVKAPEKKDTKEAEENYDVATMKRGDFAKKLLKLGCTSLGKDSQNHAIYFNPASGETTSLGIGGHGDSASQDASTLKKYLKQLGITPEAWNKA